MKTPRVALGLSRLQIRHGFIGAYIFTTLAWAILLDALPQAWARALVPVLVWADPAFFGFYFIGAQLALDRGQGTLRAFLVTPLGGGGYVLASALPLFAVSVASGLLLAFWTIGSSALSPWGILALIAVPGQFVFPAAAMAMLAPSYNSFMLFSGLSLGLLALPVFAHFGAFPLALTIWMPGALSLEALVASFSGAPGAGELGLISIALSAAWVAAGLALFRWVLTREQTGAGGSLQ